MQYNNENFINDLDKAAQARKTLANLLSQMRERLTEAESFGNNASGKLGLESEIEALSTEIDKLNKGIFRLLVLGDVNRGKSTFINALVGEEDILPTDDVSCTAIMTFLRYGKQKKVTVNFNDGKRPETIDFITFKERYTIKEDEAIQLEEQKQQAFPYVDYAVVEYPLDILSKGVEIVDSPGLNDTTALLTVMRYNIVSLAGVGQRLGFKPLPCKGLSRRDSPEHPSCTNDAGSL